MLKRNWALIALVYLVLAEALSLIPVPDLALCLIQPEHGEQASNHDNPKYCPAFHTGAALVFERTDHFLEAHDKSVIGGFTIVLAISTIGLWLATNKLWAAGEKQFGLLSESAAAQSRDMQASIKVAQDTANAAKRSAEVADRLLVLTDRPWVDLKIEIIGALKFDPVEGCLIKIKLTLLNIGRSPAIKLGYFINFCPSIPQAVESHQKMTESARYMIKDTSFGHTRFPNDPHVIEMVIGATPAEIEAGTKESDSGLVEPYIVGCAYYGLPTGGRFRYTSINKAIWIAGDARGLAPVGEYQADKLVLSTFNTGETT